VLAVSRDYLGLPLYRVASYPAMRGVPVPGATQWEQLERVAACASPVLVPLAGLAAQGALLYQDAPPVRIVSLLEENQQVHPPAAAKGVARSEERTGMSPTALVGKVGARPIWLY
jgi:hypothetical protein